MPAAARYHFDIKPGSQVLLAAVVEHRIVLAYPPATLDAAGAPSVSWRSALDDAPAHSRVWRAARHLAPLWTLLTAQVSEVLLVDLEDGPLTHVGLAQYRLYRRVLEIRDAQHALHAFIPPGVRGWALAAAAERDLDPIATDIY